MAKPERSTAGCPQAGGYLEALLQSARLRLVQQLGKDRLPRALEAELLVGLARRLGAEAPPLPERARPGPGSSVPCRSNEPPTGTRPEPLPEGLAERLAEQWCKQVASLWQRLRRDTPALASRFAADVASLESIVLGLGDPHADGQTVSEVVVASGPSLIYKPRPVALEAFFSRLLEHVGSEELSLRGLHVLDRGGYGWIRKVEAGVCETERQVERFHVRLGGLLALGHAFGATDLHEDNLVAEGEHPVLIDLETLVGSGYPREPSEALAYSVFDIDLLPSWLPGPDGQPLLSGGMGGGQLETGEFAAERPTHVARLGVRAVSPLGYEDQVVDGFQRAARRLRQLGAGLVRWCEPLQAAPYRCVMRPTREYWRALREALSRRPFGKRDAFRAELARRLPPLDRSPRGSGVFEAELSSLQSFCIPYFVGTVGQTALHLLGEPGAVAHLPEPPWQGLRRRLSQQDPEDAERQCHLIRAAFGAARARGSAPCSAPLAASRAVRRAPARPERGALAAARAIGSYLEATRCPTRDGSAAWLWPRRWEGTSVWQLSRTDASFATGQAGLAVFFAALARTTGDPLPAALARRCLRWRKPLGEALALESPESTPPALAALVYALATCGQLLQRSDLVADAQALALLLPASPPHDEPAPLSLHAGTLLALLSVAEMGHAPEPRGRVLERARAFGRRLAARARPAAERAEGAVPPALLGLALARLRETERAHGLEATAQAALARRAVELPSGEGPCGWESACGDNAPDLPGGACLAALGAVACRARAGEPSRALARLLERREAELDSLGCGNAGLIDIGLQLGERFPSVAAATQWRVARLQTRIASAADYRLRVERRCRRPGLFDGLAGVGYTWLRCHDPALPSLLLCGALRP